MMKFAIWVPLFDELSDPLEVARLAAAAEEAGWDGFFVWDQLWWSPPVRAVSDPWITLSAIATATERLRLGPMVTPVARRRPTKLLRETTTLDLLARGRLTLGVGLGSDRFAGEFSKTGEELDDRVRAEQMDETLAILAAGWTGEPVNHHGKHFLVDDVEFLPRPASGRIPVWAAGFPGNAKPVRRAARYDGFFPVHLTSPDQLAEPAAVLRDLRGTLDGYDIAVALEPSADPRPYAAVGATWCLTETNPATLRRADVRALIAAGPPR
ncbi:LLM class flavin-dependent oxidoreductase [Kribbella sp.]|uniref:LLM class flavin-dependent oxidoreductase n=1 Tax=Kribbella sp. TaxID=1871183 RepID=UPI002D3AA1A9|nr:LLM class flavin-dependent oxidoreductase [Kribbella sp.]HZX04628.1 LLM class flavin-dependent oxidoreductase [Kribbella sp.]